MILEFEQFVQICFHLVLHLDGVTQQNFWIDTRSAFLVILKFLELSMVLLFQLVNGVVIKEPHALLDLSL